MKVLPIRRFHGTTDQDRPTARVRLLLEMGSSRLRVHDELDRLDRFIHQIMRLHRACDHEHRAAYAPAFADQEAAHQ